MEMPIDMIMIPKGRRPLRDLEELAKSIKETGLINPITVNANKQLIAGYHRLEACRALGWKKVQVNVLSLDEIDAALAEIDKNLIRNEMTVLEKAETLLRRKELYEEKYPFVKHGGAPGKAGGGKKKVRYFLNNNGEHMKKDNLANIPHQDMKSDNVSSFAQQESCRTLYLPLFKKKLIKAFNLSDKVRNNVYL